MRRAIALAAAALLFSCGGNVPDGDPCDSGGECESGLCTNGICGDGSTSGNSSSGPFSCGESGGTCDPGEYCLISQTDSNETAAQCFAVPDCGSDACTCAGDDAPNNSSTCQGAVQSSSCNNDAIVITCNRASSPF